MTGSTASREEGGALMKRAALLAICVALGLALIKAAAWWFTGSIAMLASFADSALDLGASTLNALAIRTALTPADREHRFGHGKTEAVAGLAQAALVGGSAVFLVVQSAQRIAAPEALEHEGWGLAVIGVSIAATLGLTLYQRMVVRKTGSLAVQADHLHYVTDLVSNVAVLIALVLAGTFGLLWADGVFGLVIAVLIGWSAWSILRQSFDQLLDRELPDEERAKIKAIAAAVPGVIEVHDLRTRMSGTNIFVQFHAVFDGALTLAETHAISDRAEAAIVLAFPNAEVLIHGDPSTVVEERQPLAFVKG
ncbi:Ferrous-iron efflux pump FieF [Alphaproteobacteria bacterium SO-S41]|nr:Ferrous-iron efflux pump FieF [Alphaproteobacteria bacterium SO-S41]